MTLLHKKRQILPKAGCSDEEIARLFDIAICTFVTITS
jgi:hypothetical protein